MRGKELGTSDSKALWTMPIPPPSGSTWLKTGHAHHHQPHFPSHSRPCDSVGKNPPPTLPPLDLQSHPAQIIIPTLREGQLQSSWGIVSLLRSPLPTLLVYYLFTIVFLTFSCIWLYSYRLEDKKLDQG